MNESLAQFGRSGGKKISSIFLVACVWCLIMMHVRTIGMYGSPSLLPALPKPQILPSLTSLWGLFGGTTGITTIYRRCLAGNRCLAASIAAFAAFHAVQPPISSFQHLQPVSVRIIHPENTIVPNKCFIPPLAWHICYHWITTNFKSKNRFIQKVRVSFKQLRATLQGTVVIKQG